MKLLVAAMDEELVAFPSEIAGTERLVTGIGKIKATFALTRALAKHDYDEIIVVGTAGKLDPDLRTGVHNVGSAIQHDVWDAQGNADYVQLPPIITFGEGPTIATGDSFISSAAQAAFIRSKGASLVDMESYAFAWLATEAGIPITILKAVTDDASEAAHVSWNDTVAECSRQLWHDVRERL